MKKIALIIFTSFAFTLNAQKILINYDIDTTLMPKIAAPLRFWINFLKTKDDSIGAAYWNNEEVNKYEKDSYFLLEDALDFGTNNFLKLLSYATIKILRVQQVDGHYKITSLMEFDPKEGKSNVQYIFHVYLKEEKTGLKLYNPLKVNTDLYLKNATIGFVKYHFSNTHSFNKKLAEKQNNLLLKISKGLGVQMDTMQYYFGPTVDAINKIKGIDFIIGRNGEEFPSGKADQTNNIAYSCGLNEYYPHELIHLILHKRYKNSHGWFNEGVATYFGMSRGKPLEWHLKKVNTYLLSHPEINLNNLLELSNLDGETTFVYALGGFMVQLAYEKGGYELIKKLLLSGNTENDFYSACKTYFYIERNELNTYIRNELKKRFGS